MKDVTMSSLVGRRVKNRKKLRKLPTNDKNTTVATSKNNCKSKITAHNRKTKINEDDKPVLSKANQLQDLDDIFQTIKKNDENGQSNNNNNNNNKHQNNKADQQQRDRDQSYGLVQSSALGVGPIISPNPAVHRFDQATGLPVYKYTALLVGDGGGTDLCPFDCNCCF